jgi:bacillithiol system protein YtxJ
MNWIELTDESQLNTIVEQSKVQPVVIFKHSTRCSISVMAKNRLDKETPAEDLPFYYLDLLRYRPISNKIAEDFKVHHESPQVLVIKNGECIYDESHNGIIMQDIVEQAMA